MNIAVMGIRGIPAHYGGFETLAEQLAPRLVEKGHNVTVYGRSNVIDYAEEYYKGVRIVVLPTISHKYLDTPIHTMLSVFHSFFYDYDAVLICNAANSIFSFIPRLSGKKVVVNVDGIERRRKKWNVIGKLWFFFGEIFSCIFPNRIITDAGMIEKYYLERYNKKSTMIAYGYDSGKITTTDVLKKYNVISNEYVLLVGRFEPENNIHRVISAFKKVRTSKNLVLVGDAPYSSEYKKHLMDSARDDQRIVFTGYVFGAGYKEFQSNAYCYIHAGEVGGTPPALIEAMGFGNCVIVNGTDANCEVVDDAGLIYKKNSEEDLSEKIQTVLDNQEMADLYGYKAVKRVEKNYSWESVANKYEKLFLEMTGAG